ncbi:MAG: YeeE/YedE family protein [Gammaproteobacteria bacterium]|nr:YeeE/YedE family protein [Gammaproteobacteria bacterium]MDX5374570.1 YeeE/YedE family protein [Gammaproteobacteria bacterium]
MAFESFAEAQSFLLWGAFILALIMGAVVNKTNFCTMGAVSDMVNMGDFGRFRAWVLAIAVAMVGVVLFESFGAVDADGAFPPYRGSNFIWAENLIGGILFGIGMTLASGCGQKTLIRIGGGNIKSIVVLLIIAVIAYFMTNPFPGSDQTLYSVLFYPWMNPLSVNLANGQDLGSLVAGPESEVTARLIIGGILALALLFFVFKSKDFRGSFDNILGGLVVGLAVFGAWWVSSNAIISMGGGETYTLQGFASDWAFLADSPEGKPASTAALAAQSYTFINPMGQTLGYTAAGFSSSYLTFGVMALLGVILGSFLWAIVSKGFRVEWFANLRDFVNHVIGAVLMGFGGVLAMGCTIGQGITGLSTLALGSFIAFGGIVLGSALTMKIQYYKLVYEDEATFFKALVTSLVDFRLLPKGLRKLEAI